jgi:glutathione S-transferase
MMKLYYHPLSTYSQKALIALHEKQLRFEPHIVNVLEESERIQYREIYPLGKIPLLILEDGHVIPESTIIVEYADMASEKGPRLIPNDPVSARQVRFFDRMLDFYLNDSVANLVFEGWKPEAERDAALVERCRERVGIMYDYLDKHLEGKTWLRDEHFSMADCAAAPPLFYAQQTAPFADRPNIGAYFERAQTRESYGKVLAEAAPYLEELQKSTA